ncbi:hypothetical protein VNO78_24197 [Psophocarpus tetragonolobus]|uniref:Uncharacterized protein n=1 Tax=Psophocarpus tetragonolobus TaxID=3891 RepID=A0AAN9XEN0_PSOTE
MFTCKPTIRARFDTILRNILNIVIDLPPFPLHPFPFLGYLRLLLNSSSSPSLHTLPILCLPILHTFLSILTFHPLSITLCLISSHSMSLSSPSHSLSLFALCPPFPLQPLLLLSIFPSFSAFSITLHLPFTISPMQ